ncbi:MAG: sigma-70 family RNA polymerase sigma factor [Ruminococcus sp.]|uniref:RNA polymerase sigma factor n=1 Tax=Ruminococcus sp. TaxID=41978 RepID=UPI0025FE6202|nr:sigma-70 family RNA polymerase sigma factor [Ruminococcus sp.]MCR5600816.1 sigma-70 family RNA polymerase sigma factor [Ruminococcus sp.]
MTSRELTALMKSSPVNCHKALVKEYGRYVYAIVYNKLRGCGTSEDIEECVSDVFAALFMQCEYDLSSENDLKYLIGTIAKRKAIDYFRSLSARGSHISETDEDDMRELVSDFSVDERVDRSELRRVLLDKIDELGEPDSTILIQKFYYNRNSKEIAESVSMTAAAVRQRCARAMDKLRTKLLEVGMGR